MSSSSIAGLRQLPLLAKLSRVGSRNAYDKPDYAALHSMLMPDEWPPKPDNEAATQALFAERGVHRAQLAVSDGQHSHSDGMFYGGRVET